MTPNELIERVKNGDLSKQGALELAEELGGQDPFENALARLGNGGGLTAWEETALVLEKMDEKKESPCPDAEPSGAGSRLLWTGNAADLGRVYLILGGMLGCTGAEWERHFIGPDGKPLTGAVENAKKSGETKSRSNQVQALMSARRGMESQ